MDVAMLHDPQVVAWAEAPEPTRDSPVAALVRPLVAATCDFDHLLVSGRLALGYPVALGHEVVGVITDVGDEVPRFRAGDRVIIPFQVSCGTCRRCRGGLTRCVSTVSGDPFSLQSYGCRRIRLCTARRLPAEPRRERARALPPAFRLSACNVRTTRSRRTNRSP